ncbi:hypothetical protein B1757_13530 [Acidithiobacillus marinus]|uniref:Integrase catalytic domain-containing protein n=1 Tax=Acidithiobacillus marinus TaxID=187490 RepID=A0A2I1DIN8_9PROT|nr:hypothetical protein B1757_13530 [Acidithiobacillus marinus]
MQIAERWILARLHHCQFFTLAELNAAIRSLVLRLNTKPFRKRLGSRAEVFATQPEAGQNPRSRGDRMDAQAPVHQCGGRLRSNYENTLAADGVFTGHCRALTVFF